MPVFLHFLISYYFPILFVTIEKQKRSEIWTWAWKPALPRLALREVRRSMEHEIVKEREMINNDDDDDGDREVTSDGQVVHERKAAILSFQGGISSKSGIDWFWVGWSVVKEMNKWTQQRT